MTTLITANYIDGEPVEFNIAGRVIPLVVGWHPDGAPVTARDLTRHFPTPPSQCDHAGATWSSNLALFCPHCHAAMFLPPCFLANRPGYDLIAMHELWCAAGWPEWISSNGAGHWNAATEYWRIIAHPLFTVTGGIAVRNDRAELFVAAVAEFTDEMQQKE